MPDLIDLRTNPQRITGLPIGTIVTGVGNPPTDTKWRVVNERGTLKKIHDVA